MAKSFSIRKLLLNFGRLIIIVTMKQKFNSEPQVSALGSIIRTVRKDKGLTQEQLGKKLGLAKSGISKIEKGLTQISYEDASLIMQAMGERLEMHVVGMEEPVETQLNRSKFVTLVTFWCARKMNVSFGEAYRYLLTHHAIQFLEEVFAVEQTLTQDQILSDVEEVCQRDSLSEEVAS